MGLRVHWLQHVPFEGLGSIEGWLSDRGARVSVTRLYEGPSFAQPGDMDLLIVMGGPMSVNDEDHYPWLRDEKRLIEMTIAAGTPVLGVCLGAQLIASALGARVSRNPCPEIGWFPVRSTGLVPDGAEVFHWHGETFDLPPGARHAARSEACENQAFTLGGRVVALQFHLETTPSAARALVESCPADLAPGPFVQSAEAILGRPERFARINAIMGSVLDGLSSS